jgi:hypothetical protein
MRGYKIKPLSLVRSSLPERKGGLWDSCGRISICVP